MIHMQPQIHYQKIAALKHPIQNAIPKPKQNQSPSMFKPSFQSSANTSVNYYRGEIPCTSNPAEWFSFADKDNDGLMSQEEAIASINIYLCPKNSDERLFIRNGVQKTWSRYDTDCDTYISLDEFLNNNMIEFVINLENEWKWKFIESDCNSQSKKKDELPIAYLVLTGPLPDLSTQANEWFDKVDTEKQGMLSKEQVIRGLNITLEPTSPEEKSAIRSNITNFWYVFDVDHNGLVDKWEFLSKGGMGDALIQMEQEWKNCRAPKTSQNISKVFSKGTRRHSYEPPPSLLENPEAWFDHFDIDSSHFLSQKEVIHGLYVTLNALTSEKRQVIREHVVSNWDKYDKDNNGVIDKTEFLNTGLSRCITRLLKLWPQSDNCVTADKDALEVTVCIPKGKGPRDIIKMSSPRTQEFILVMIPEKKKWKRSSDGSSSDSFIVLF